MKKLLVILASLALVGAFAASAAAADWGFYGSSRVQTFYTALDFGDQEDPDSDGDMGWSQQGNSRIGANVSGGPIKGRFEYGTGINLRLLWGEYDFGNMQLRIGQDYTPVHTWTSSMVYGGDDGLCGLGAFYGGRMDQIQLRFSGVEIALIENTTSDVSPTGNGDVDTMLPKIEAAYRTSIGPGSIGVMAGYNGYKVESPDGDDDVQVTSWVLQAEGMFSFGAAYVNVSGFVAGNPGNYGGYYDIDYLSPYSSSFASSSVVVDGNWDNEDASSVGGTLVVGFAASDTMNIEGGLGMTSHKNDDVGDGDADATIGGYVQANITVAQGFHIIPEVGHIAFGDDASGNDTGSLTYAGAKWQMNF